MNPETELALFSIQHASAKRNTKMPFRGTSDFNEKIEGNSPLC